VNFFRYRRPSLNTLLGITKAKKRVKKELGITAAMKPFRFWTNAKRRFKRKIGYESEGGRLIRNGLPRPGGCLVVVLVVIGMAMAAVAMGNDRRQHEDTGLPRSCHPRWGDYTGVVAGDCENADEFAFVNDRVTGWH
jgi:hypothetical protein